MKKMEYDVKVGNGYKTWTYLTEDPDEIKFISYVLNQMISDSRWWKCIQSEYSYAKHLIEQINTAIDLANVVLKQNYKVLIQALETNVSAKEIQDRLCELLSVLYDICDWEPYTMEEEEPISYMIKDCSDSVEMTEQEVLELVREKLGMNIMIKRA